MRERRELMDPTDEDAQRYLLEDAQWFLHHDRTTDDAYYQPRDRNNPKVSIVILHYGSSPDATLNALKNLAHTTYTNYDIILVDNNSPDRFSERYESELLPQIPAALREKITLVSNKANLAYCGGNNQAARIALARDSDYVLYLNNDALFEKDGLQKLVETVKDRPEIGAVQPNLCVYNEGQQSRVVGALTNDENIPDDVRQFAEKRMADYVHRLEGTGEMHPIEGAENLYTKEPTLLGTAQMVRSDMLRLSGGFDTRLFMFGDEGNIGYRYAMTGLKKAMAFNVFVAHLTFESYDQFRAQYLVWRNHMQVTEQMYHRSIPERPLIGQEIALAKSTHAIINLDTDERVRNKLGQRFSGDDLTCIAVFKGIADGLLGHYSPTKEARAKIPGETEQINSYAEMFSRMTSAPDILRELFWETDPHKIRLMIYALYEARDQIHLSENLAPQLRERLKTILCDAARQWRAWVQTTERNPEQIQEIRAEFIKKVTSEIGARIRLPTPLDVDADRKTSEAA